MPEQLALKYRPATFDDLVGQKAVTVPLRLMVAAGNIPTALLFRGCRGSGKTTSARILAAAANCHNPPGPCRHCPSCKAVADGTSMDIIEIDAASNGLVDNIRDLRQQVLYSVGGNYRVVILDEAHSMSSAAFNALLKTLEEPPPQTVFVLCTTEPGKIPDTVASRCMALPFKRLTVAEIAQRLTEIAAAENIDADPALLLRLAERADGAMRDAIMNLDLMARTGISTLAEYVDLTGEVDYGPILVAAVATGNIATAHTAANAAYIAAGDADALTDAITATLRDLAVLHAGGDLAYQGTALTHRQSLADKLDAETVRAALGVCWDLKIHTRFADNRRLLLDLALAMLCEKFATKPSTSAPRKLTLAEMAELH